MGISGTVRLALLALAASVAPACERSVPGATDTRQLASDELPPSFADHPTIERFTGPPAAPDFATLPGARMHGTHLRRGAADGPNFAGRFTVVRWECGRDCVQFMILDAATGDIHDGFTTRWGVEHRVDSDLLVVNPRPADAPRDGRQRTQYYRWTGTHLELLAESR